MAAPLLIIQGRHDTRTPARPIQIYEQRIEHQERMLKFAYRVLGQNVAAAAAD